MKLYIKANTPEREKAVGFGSDKQIVIDILAGSVKKPKDVGFLTIIFKDGQSQAVGIMFESYGNNGQNTEMKFELPLDNMDYADID